KVTRRRVMATSPFVHGAFETHSVKDITQAVIQVYIQAASAGDLQSDLQVLIDAFSQLDYEFHMVNNGYEYAWSCDAADYNALVTMQFLLNNATVVLNVPRQPIP